MSSKQTVWELANLGARQAIVTKTLLNQETGDYRVVATADAGVMSFDWNDELGVLENHCAAALQLHERFGWHERNRLIVGSIGQDGYVFVQVARDLRGAARRDEGPDYGVGDGESYR